MSSEDALLEAAERAAEWLKAFDGFACHLGYDLSKSLKAYQADKVEAAERALAAFDASPAAAAPRRAGP